MNAVARACLSGSNTAPPLGDALEKSISRTRPPLTAMFAKMSGATTVLATSRSAGSGLQP